MAEHVYINLDNQSLYNHQTSSKHSSHNQNNSDVLVGKFGHTQIVNLPIRLPNGEIQWQAVQLTAVEPVNNSSLPQNCKTERDKVVSGSEYETPFKLIPEVDTVNCASADIRKRREKCNCPNCQIREEKRLAKKKSQSDTNFDDDPDSSNEECDKLLHICPIPGCSRTFQKTSHLKSHVRGHSGVRPYQCTWENCSKSFTRSDELARHLRIHSCDNRFACKECSKVFTRRDHLKKHQLARHTDSKR